MLGRLGPCEESSYRVSFASWLTLRENRLARFSEADIGYVYVEFAAPCAIEQLGRLGHLVVGWRSVRV
jgi:hypothetical protein